jgi:ribosomal-protein-alanine N-acetyltransferase
MGCFEKLMKTNIRMMTALDLDEVVAIETACSLDPWPRSIFNNCLDRHQCYVLTANHRVIGFAVLMFADVECQLLNLSIAPEWQNQGYGKMLLKELIESAKIERAQQFLLEVRCTNESAIALYRKLGFIVIGERKEYYLTPTGREDAHVMLLNLH